MDSTQKHLSDVELWRAAVADLESNKASLGQLRQDVSQGALRILVGAGISHSAGFPDWKTLQTAILSILDSGTNPQQRVADPKRVVPLSVDALKHIIDRLGQGAAGDLARDTWEGEFEEKLGNILYGSQASSERMTRTDKIEARAAALFRQLASLAWFSGCKLYTTNYDDQLERAVAYIGHRATVAPGAPYLAGSDTDHLYFCGAPNLTFRTNTHLTQERLEPSWLAAAIRHPIVAKAFQGKPIQYPTIDHLHGFISPPDDRGVWVATPVILGDVDYHDAGAVQAVMSPMICDAGTLLILGMSLQDPNLRHVLIETKRERKNSRVYAVVKADKSGYDNWLRRYYDKVLGVTPIFVTNFKTQPALLRNIITVHAGNVRGAAKAPWTTASYEWAYGMRFGDSAMVWPVASRVLACALRQLRRRFCIPEWEHIDVEVFAATTAAARINLLGSSAETPYREVSLSVDIMSAHGVAGMSFVTGEVLSCTGREGGIDNNMNAAERAKLAPGLRFHVSTLAVTLLDTPSWVPVATVCVHSNSRTPFWEAAQHPLGDRKLLETFLRSLPAKVHEALKSESAGGGAVTGGAPPSGGDGSPRPSRPSRARRPKDGEAGA